MGFVYGTYADPPEVYAPDPAIYAGIKQYALGKVGPEQFVCLDNLWTKESNWKPWAQNPVSTAYGIAQFLDSTWAGTGYEKSSDPYVQVDAGLVYISRRYQSSCAAWDHSVSTNWY